MSLRLQWAEQPARDSYRQSKKHEMRLAKELGGRRLPNSGGARRSRWDPRRSQGADLISEFEVVEHKFTRANSIRLHLDWWLKLCDGAARIGKPPALMLTFVRKMAADLDLVVISKEHYLRLTRGPHGLGEEQ
jgi:hypothetical protein